MLGLGKLMFLGVPVFAICYNTPFNSLTTKELTTVFICKFSKNVQSKVYYIETSKTREQTV